MLKGLRNVIWPLVVLIIALAAFYLKPWQTKPQETISVSATGRTQAIPNVAKINATIETTNPNLEVARRENEEKVEGVIAKLRDLGVDEKDIQTQSVSGGPGYEIMIYPPSPRKPTTNQFSTTIEVTIRNFEIADEVISTLTQNGTSNLYGPNLTLDEKAQEDAKTRARQDAVEGARQKATQLAQLSGRKLGKAVKIQEQGDVIFPQPFLAQSEADLKQSLSQIQPGQNEVTISLSVDFALE